MNSALESVPETGTANKFLSALVDLQQQHLVHAQVDALPPLCKALTAVLSTHCEYSEPQIACLRCAVLLLFQPCSTHLHQPLTAALAPHIKSVACTEHLCSAVIRSLDLCQRQSRGEDRSAITDIPLAPAWATLLRAAPKQPAFQRLATRILGQLAEHLHAAMEQISTGAHAAPQLSEDIQVPSLTSHKLPQSQ